MSFDVIIPVASKDLSFVFKTIELINCNLEGVSQIFIITNKKHFRKLNNKISNNCVLLDEDILINELSYYQVQTYIRSVSPKSVNCTGWYFQQFLKYAFGLSKYCNSEYYLSWDADTLPLHKLSFFSDNHPLFTRKNEYHEPYFITLKKLLNLTKVVDYSFIAEHMLFKTDIVKDMIYNISNANVKGDTWVQKIINACSFEEGKYAFFSEFETYGTYCVVKYPDLYKVRQLNTFRAAGLIRGRYINRNLLEKLSMDLDIASFEASHALFPWNIGYKIRRICDKIFSLFCEN